MTWLCGTPSAVVGAMLRMIPRLEADEDRRAAGVVGVGRSFKVGSWAKRQMSEWNRAAEGGRATKAPTKQDLRAIGIGMKVVKSNG